MRVALLAKRDNKVTGLRRYSETLMRQMLSENIDATLHFPVAPLPGVMTRLGKRLGWDAGTFFETYPLRAQTRGADVYHLTSETLATLGVVARVQPSIVTVHAFFTYLLRHDPALAMYKHPFDRLFDQIAVRGLRRAQAIIAVSEYVKELLIEQVEIPSERIHVIHEAVDHRMFYSQSVPTAFYEKHGLNSDTKYILYVGSEQPRKNFLMLLRAYARVREGHSDVKLLKVGQPELMHERAKAERLIAELGIQGDVIFRGHAGSDLPLFYNLCHIFVFPSLYEGFGFPPLEAMACGAPVVCSNATSLPEVVGDAALLFEPRDENALVYQLERMLSDECLRQRYAERSRARARRFDWTVTASRTIDVYHQVFAEAQGIRAASLQDVRG